MTVHVFVYVYVHGLCGGYERAAGSASFTAAVDTPVNAVLGSAHLSASDTDMTLHWTTCDI